MTLSWDKAAWEDYLHWYNTDKTTFKRINRIIKDMLRNPLEGLGKPERLKANLSGYYSRRIDEEHRIVYKVYLNRIHIVQCRFHY